MAEVKGASAINFGDAAGPGAETVHQPWDSGERWRAQDFDLALRKRLRLDRHMTS
jgi:hypothetical protein